MSTNFCAAAHPQLSLDPMAAVGMISFLPLPLTSWLVAAEELLGPRVQVAWVAAAALSETLSWQALSGGSTAEGGTADS